MNFNKTHHVNHKWSLISKLAAPAVIWEAKQCLLIQLEDRYCLQNLIHGFPKIMYFSAAEQDFRISISEANIFCKVIQVIWEEAGEIIGFPHLPFVVYLLLRSPWYLGCLGWGLNKTESHVVLYIITWNMSPQHKWCMAMVEYFISLNHSGRKGFCWLQKSLASPQGRLFLLYFIKNTLTVECI